MRFVFVLGFLFLCFPFLVSSSADIDILLTRGSQPAPTVSPYKPGTAVSEGKSFFYYGFAKGTPHYELFESYWEDPVQLIDSILKSRSNFDDNIYETWFPGHEPKFVKRVLQVIQQTLLPTSSKIDTDQQIWITTVDISNTCTGKTVAGTQPGG